MQLCNHKMTRLFSALLIASIMMSGMGGPVSAGIELTDIVRVSFVGGGSIHLTFGSSDGNPSALVLKVMVNGSPFTELNIISGTASLRLTGLPLNSDVTFVNKADGSTLASTNTSYLEGTMLYDEIFDAMTLTPPLSSNPNITVTASHSLTIRNSKIVSMLGIETQGNASAHIDNVIVQSGASFVNAGSETNPSINIENSVFRGLVSLGGGASFQNNEVALDLLINRHSDLQIKHNVLEGPIIFDCNYSDYSTCDWTTGPYPTILDNSFLGDIAFQLSYGVSLPIFHVGSNYYGDPKVVAGSVNPASYHRIFLKERGALNTSGQIVMDEIASWGNTINKSKPGWSSVHLNSYIIGQNTIAHKSAIWSGMMGRKTLLSIDLGTSFDTLTGVKVIVHFDGKDYVKKDIVLHNTIQDCVKNNPGKCTIDFELDPVIYSGSAWISLPITVDVDLSEVSDSEYTVPYTVIYDTIGFHSPPQRPLKINVIPVALGWLCSGKADASTTASILRDYLPPMFALRKQDIDVRIRPPHTYNCLSPVASLSPTLIAEGIIAETTAVDKLFESDPADLLVVVVPAQALKSLVSNDIEGMSLKGLRNVILVNEAFPDAVLHEMGHWAGLNYDPEQYDQFPDAGLPVRDTTAYDPDGRNVKYMSGSIEHFTAPGFYGWNGDRIYDTMSNQPSNWPLYATTETMKYAIYNLLGNQQATSPDATQMTTPAPSPSTISTSGMRTLFFYSPTFREPAGGGDGAYFLKPGLPHLFDITGMGLSPGDSPEKTTPHTVHLTYALTGYDVAGTPVFSAPIETYLNDDYGSVLIPSNAFIYHTLQVPENVVRIVVMDSPAKGNQIYLDQTMGGSVESHFVTPTAGSTLSSGEITLSWTNPSPHLLHLVGYSTDNGVTWNSSGDLPFEGDSLVIPNQTLPASSHLTFRLITTDGFNHFEDRVGSLVVANRAPQMQIDSPQDGLAIPPGTKITLSAQVTDLEDGGITTGNWTSSLDGVLGQGHFLQDIALSNGTHTLTFSTQDSAGAPVSGHVTVTVAAVSQVDLGLAPDAISLLYPSMGVGQVLHSLTSAVPYSVTVHIQGVGIDCTPTLGLYVTPRGGTETLLKSEPVVLTAFTEGTLTASYTPSVTGEYTFRAAILNADPPDSTPANNEATLDISGLPPSYSVSGRVQTKLYLAGIPWAEVSDELGQRYFTNEYSLYTLVNLQPGQHTLTIVKDGYQFDPVTVEVTNANITDFALEGIRVKYMVYGIGPLLPGVIVSDGVGHKVLTDSLGWFALPNLAPGSYVLTFSKPGYEFSPSAVDVVVFGEDVPVARAFTIMPLGNLIFLPLIRK